MIQIAYDKKAAADFDAGVTDAVKRCNVVAGMNLPFCAVLTYV